MSDFEPVSKYNHLPQQWFDDLVEKLGGQEMAERILRGSWPLQLEDVYIKEDFRATLASATDFEMLLNHAMDWLLRQVGEANIAIYCCNGNHQLELAAYMKYTVAGTRDFVEALKRGMVQRISSEGFVVVTEAEGAAALSAAELPHILGNDILGAAATYLGKCVATIVLFRANKQPFTAADMYMLLSIVPIFAQYLIVLEEKEAKKKARKKSGPRPRKPKNADPADWWKRGEPPPY